MIARDPAENVVTLRILQDVEWRRLMTDWNNTEVSYPEGDLCLHQLFELQAGRTPDQVALVFEDERLTYAELNRRANLLARRLRELEIGPETCVGLFVERSTAMIVGILGILKAGAAYVPIDTAFPKERIAFMLQDAKVGLLLTQTTLVGNLPSSDLRTICLDLFDWKEMEFAENRDCPSGPENLAYVIYTSGSTGRPKGVCIEHRNIVNYVLAAVERYCLNFGMNHAMVSTVAADLCKTAIFPALVTGGCLHVVSQERAQSYTLLSNYFEHERIDVLKIVPSHLAALQAAGNAQTIMPRARLILGGEAPRLDWIVQLRRLAPECEIYNEYGPTETTVGALVYHVGAQLPSTLSGTLPSGRPLPNSYAYILDENRHPVAIGVVGELCIGGRGVGRGYLNCSEMTAQKFITDPFVSDSSGRIYRTGDRARYLADGNIEFLGRFDGQVKIHGYRVELGEIEQAIRKHDGVRDVVVTSNEMQYGSKELVAYVVPRRPNHLSWTGKDPYSVQKGSIDWPIRRLQPVDEEILTPVALRKFLKEQLPRYMIPSAYVLMEKMPLTPNGKIDRKSLPAPSISAEVASEYVAPRNTLEQLLADIWARFLKVERIGIYDDFFDLGGHSLLAVRVIAEFEKVSNRRLPLAMLLQAPTIAGLAALLGDESQEPNWSSLVPIETGGSKPPLFLVHEGDGSIMLYRRLVQHLGPGQPVYGLQSEGLKGDGLVHRTVEDMASHYIQEVRSVQARGPYYLGGYCLGGTIALEMAQQLTVEGERVALVAMVDTYNLSLIPPSKLHCLTFLHMFQSLWFHFANFASAKNGNRRRFLEQKWEITSSQLGIWLRAWQDRLVGEGKSGRFRSDRYWRLKQINHCAMARYLPKPYAGRVVLIRPRGHFWGETDPTFGWDGVVRNQLKVRVTAAYPKGIMLDPYVQMLAQDLKECLHEAQAAESLRKAGEVTAPSEQENSDASERLDSKQMAQIMAGIQPALQQKM